MEQRTTLAQSIDIVQQKAQYDEACKKVLAEKIILAWICMNPPKERSNTITEYSLTEKHHIGKVKEVEEYYDLMSAIMVCLGRNEDETEHELLCLLDVLLSSDKKAKEKNKSIEQIAEEVELDVESVKHYIEVLKEN